MIPKGENRRRNQRMTDNSMIKKIEDVIKDTKGEIRRVIEEWLIIQWSKDTKGEIRRRNQRMTDNSMVKRHQRWN